MNVIIRGSEYGVKKPRGRSKVISTSKIKKRIVSMKNRREKEARAFFFASNPHSNDVSFSRSFVDFLPSTRARQVSLKEIRRAKVVMNKITGMVRSPINRWRRIKIAILRRQNVNTR